MKRFPVLYIHNSPLIGGGNKSLLGLFDQLRASEFRPVAVLPDSGPMEEQLRQRGIPYAVLDLDQALRKGCQASVRVVFGFLRFMLQHGVRILHANGPIYYRHAALAAKCLHIPRICHLQLPPDASELRWAFKTIPHVTITCSVDLGRQISHMLPNLDAVVPIPNAVDIDVFKSPRDITGLRRHMKLEQTSPVVTIVGLVSERKGHRYFLEMAQQVLVCFPRAEFLVVGEDILGHGAYRRAMEQYAEELSIGKRVRFLGFRYDVVDWIAASDIIVLPSLQEGLPISLVEAHALGKPVVSTGVDGIPEIVEDGVTGILVPARDTPALTKAVLTLLEDQAMRQRMGAAGRDRVERLFSVKAHAEKVKQIYRRLLA